MPEYIEQAEARHLMLTQRIELSAYKVLGAAAAGSGTTAALAQAVLLKPDRGINALVKTMQAASGITITSTDAELDAAVIAPSSINALKGAYNMFPPVTP